MADTAVAPSPAAAFMDRAVPSVPMPPTAPLPHDHCFTAVSRDQFESRRQRARASHLQRAEKKQGIGASRQQPKAAAHVDPAVPADGDDDDDALYGDGYQAPTTSLRQNNADNDALETTIEIPDVAQIEAHFEAGGVLDIEDARKIIIAATEVLRAEPNVLRMAGPVTVVGDVHGQFYDLLTVFRRLGGNPAKTQYLFLGDYVDRGSFSTEIVLSLFARKIVQPYTMWMLRGNHESGHLTNYFNFASECRHKYNEAIYQLFLKAFDCLPLAAVVNGEIFCVHGGLSPFIRTVEDIEAIHRFRDPPQRGAMCDLLWADPMEEDEEELWPDAMFLHNDVRACSYVFTHAATCDFLQRNHLACLIRAHEAQEEGFRFLRKVPETGMPACVSIFSAPNYCGCNNTAAILLIDGRQLQVKQFHSAPAPYTLPNFLNGFTWSVPFVLDKIACIVYDVMTLYCDDEVDSDTPASVVVQLQSSLPKLPSLPPSNHNTPRIAAGPAAAVGPSGAAALTALQAPALSILLALANRLLLPRVLRLRGRFMRAKIIAAVKFIKLYQRAVARVGTATVVAAQQSPPPPSAGEVTNASMDARAQVHAVGSESDTDAPIEAKGNRSRSGSSSSTSSSSSGISSRDDDSAVQPAAP